MIARSTPSCSQAVLYYYDYMTSSSHDGVPEDMIGHISSCQHCQEEVSRLQKELEKNDAPDADQSKKKLAIVKTLEYHFAHINRYVTCSLVKAFIPALVVESMNVRVPTPITVHIDNCPACNRDLKTIRELKLEPIQLHCLAQLFSEQCNIKTEDCLETQKNIPVLMSMDFSQINANILRHYCHCPDCQNIVYQRRELLQKRLGDTPVHDQFSCEHVTPSDLFDYVIPYDIDPENDEYAKFRGSLTSHVQGCPICMKKAQELHRVIFDIINRDDSDTVTCFQTDKTKDLDDDSSSEDLYSGWPVNVQVLNRNDIDISKTPSSGTSSDNSLSYGGHKTNQNLFTLKRLVKPIIAAAIVIIGFSILLTTKTAQAVDLSQIYEALKAVSNIHITKYSAGQSEPAQEIWFSNALKCYLTQSKAKVSFWDVKNKTTSTRYPDGKVEVIKRTEKATQKMDEYISQRMNIIPFISFSEAPDGAQWQCVTDDKNYTTKGSGIEIYELTWKRIDNRSTEIDCKWLGYIDSDTYLLKKTQYFEKDETEDYVLKTMYEVDYPDENQVMAIIDEMVFE